MEWMQSANAKLAKTSVSKVERTFDVVPQLAYSKTIAKSDKKHSRHFIRSEAIINEKVIYRKGPRNRANKVFKVGLWVSYIFFWFKTKILKGECWV